LDNRTIVFVCEHGTGKSVVAMACFNRMSRERNLPFRAVARGMAPDAELPTFVREGMRSEGLEIGAFEPTRFGDSDVPPAFKVVSFDQPAVAAIVAGRVSTIAWNNLPAVSADYATARDAIWLRVAALVDSLVT
jgi:arsenate reductase (thioredoxin)